MKKVQVAVVGSGFGALTAAALLAKAGLQVTVLEMNKYPGGCASTYKRKGFWFETGATTLVGLDEHMPLRYMFDATGIKVPMNRLEVPMQVRLTDGTFITRYPNLEDWILEAERVFGKSGQREFWEACYAISQKVWRTSLRQISFPFSSFSDLAPAIKNFEFRQLTLIPKAFQSLSSLIAKHGLTDNKRFVQFVDQQLLITAQNLHQEVNVLFGATALCYTLYGNYYVPGGLRQLAQAAVNFLEANGGEILYKHKVISVMTTNKGAYLLNTSKGEILTDFVIGGLPMNNLPHLFKESAIRKKLGKYMLNSEKVNSALTWSIAFERTGHEPDTLHHQVHVPGGVPYVGSDSVFISLSHPEDELRAPAGVCLAAVSTHVMHPAAHYIDQKKELEQWVIQFLAAQGFLEKDKVLYVQAATPGAWIKWTGREWGQVGGYPQYMAIKPWRMKDARLDGKKAYVCGDTVYPGQGIPGVCLGGISAAHKLLRDHFPSYLQKLR
ncbi:amine oxidase [Rufibacter sp. DG15C]|uniref:phytoene desaturase family protein n=1 Tax=Rufibacter sp. DG15C TaxID=1379909 RepID=UPI00078E29BF|nr:NAD(P)/FAD-dependent oxidoreductase [Rufibacter sp. DG15C]AMM52120.1 amine oxidase [Rufibacter sp. DG15C]